MERHYADGSLSAVTLEVPSQRRVWVGGSHANFTDTLITELQQATKVRSLLTAVLAFSLGSPAFGQSEVRVDDDYLQIGDNAKVKRMYQVAPAPFLSLDFTGYRFSLWPKEDPGA